MAADLSLVSTDDLLAELKSRHEHCVFLGNTDRSEKETSIRYFWGGQHLIVAGMLSRMLYKLYREMDEDGEEIGTDDA